MTRLLFVYGTLMRRSQQSRLGHDMQVRLEQAGTWLGPAIGTGRLHDLGLYPMMVPTQLLRDRVHGELFRLQNAKAMLALLDRYEGLPPGELIGSKYERLQLAVRRIGDGEYTAWVYGRRAPLHGPTASREVFGCHGRVRPYTRVE